MEQEGVLALLCNAEGIILDVICNGLPLGRAPMAGLPFSDLLDSLEVEKGNAFLQHLNKHRRCSDWELVVMLEDRLMPLRFCAACDGERCLIMGGSRPAMGRLAKELASTYEADQGELKNLMTTLETCLAIPPIDESWILQDLARVNNELANAQRELARKNAELESTNWDLRKSEEKFRNIFENAPFGIYQTTQTRLLSVNPVLARMFGYNSPDEMLAAHLDVTRFFVNPARRKSILENVSGTFVQHEVEYWRKDGSTFTGNLRIRVVTDESSAFKYYEGFVEDITERKRAESQLRQSEQRFRKLAENIDSVFWMLDRGTGKILYVSPAFERIWGRTRQGVYENVSVFLDSIHHEDRHKLPARIEKAFQGENGEEEYRIVFPDGSVRWIHDRVFAVRNDRGEIHKVAGLAEDTTERRKLEEQFRQAQKMEAIGLLAGGVAHDFNNILAATLMHLGLLQQRGGSSDMKEDLREVENEVMRAANLTRQLLLFSRRQAARFEPLDMDALAGNLLKMLRRLLGENIKIHFYGCGRAPWVKADPGMIEQVLMNLCVNARDAMPAGGTLTLRTMIEDRSPLRAGFLPDARAGRYVSLEVIDTGHGMTDSVRNRIFEPFFTTKEAGKGTGLGLATVYGIVKQHDGWIEVESAVGKGSTFRVLLPQLTEVPEHSSAAGKADLAFGGSETILLVEDDTSVRRMASLCLRKLGYAVLEAANGTEALDIWKRHEQTIALLLTDMIMPETMTGLELAERLKSAKGNLRIIVSTGYSAELVTPRPRGERVTFLPKPYKPSVLAKVVRQCLDQK